MSLYSNIPEINQDVAVKFFEQYFNQKVAITENEVNAIVAYFEGRALTTEAANAMVVAVIQGATDQNLKPMEILEQFKVMDNKQIDSYLAYFLNLTRYPTSLLGLSNIPRVSKYVERAIKP